MPVDVSWTKSIDLTVYHYILLSIHSSNQFCLSLFLLCGKFGRNTTSLFKLHTNSATSTFSFLAASFFSLASNVYCSQDDLICIFISNALISGPSCTFRSLWHDLCNHLQNIHVFHHFMGISMPSPCMYYYKHLRQQSTDLNLLFLNHIHHFLMIHTKSSICSLIFILILLQRLRIRSDCKQPRVSVALLHCGSTRTFFNIA